MKPEKIYTLSNGRQITASALAEELSITTRAARNRLNRGNDIAQVFKTTSQLKADKAKVWTLSNGVQGTVQCIALLTGLKEDTLRQRLSKSTEAEKVLAKQTLKIELFTLLDGTSITIQDYATKMLISASQAKRQLLNMAIESKALQTAHKLSNGVYVTVEDVMSIAGISNTAAKYRLRQSNDPCKILRKPCRSLLTPIRSTSHHMFQCNVTGSIHKSAIF